MARAKKKIARRVVCATENWICGWFHSNPLDATKEMEELLLESSDAALAFRANLRAHLFASRVAGLHDALLCLDHDDYGARDQIKIRIKELLEEATQ